MRGRKGMIKGKSKGMRGEGEGKGLLEGIERGWEWEENSREGKGVKGK